MGKLKADSAPTNSPEAAPQYGHHRMNVEAADSLPETARAHGINMGEYDVAHIQVVPESGGTSDPTATVLWWSEAAGRFIQEHTPITRTGVGAGVAYEFTVECKGRIMFVALSGTVNSGQANWVNVYVAGYDRNYLS